MTIKKAAFAAGCFWHVQYAFDQLPGIIKTLVGFMGGNEEEFPDASYKEVSTGKTGHAEIVYIEYDSDKISYEKLLETFWKEHDPTQGHRQGPDVGSQYRSAVFYYNEEQEKLAKTSMNEKQKTLDKEITTEIVPAGKFIEAEEYHQKYFEKTGQKSCGV